MTITVFDGYLLLKSTYIDEIIATPGDYLKIDITGNINCCNSNCGEQNPTLTIDLPQALDQDKAEFADGGLKIYPLFFGLTEFIDGVYQFDLKRYQDDVGTVAEMNCIFVDVTIKCKVANLLDCILQEKILSEKPGTIAHILHYSLVNGSNCGCDCAAMCDIYKELVKLLNKIAITNPGCGC